MWTKRVDGKHGAKIVLIIALLATSILSAVLAGYHVSADTTQAAYAPNRSLSPTDIPSAPSPANRVVITLITEEKLGQLADGVTYNFWTFNGTVPGPLIRLRVGQVVEMHIVNPPNSTMTHSIDSHGILGQGGGGAYSQTAPGNESVFQFTAMNPGLFLYHCATPDIPTHIANGMYGLMLVEPKGGLPKVNDEFYIVQGEFYTMGPYGQQGFQSFSYQKAQAETPDYIVFNGRVGTLMGSGTMRVKVGDSVRVFFGNAGPNLDSSLHIIGGIMDRVYEDGALASSPLLGVQTVLVPAGSAAMVEFTAQTPGVLTLVDHSLFRIHQGAIATFTVTGPNNPAIIMSIKNGTGPASMAAMTNETVEAQTLASATESSTNSTEVVIENYAYNPTDITVPVGTTVTWVNQDSVGHTVTEGDPNSPKSANLRVFDSSGEALTGQVALIGPGQSWSFTFTAPGTYEYYCIVHPYMIGHITVTAASGSNVSSTAQGSGYGDLTNFTITLGGRDIVSLLAIGVVVLVGLMLVFARPRKSEAN
ncbi:MAG TPA: copper-containing nitrite reductase [Candidatus Acidoferrales bacterium]|nr:copper-containing nitrite reductase [Candidatus Acidoferrales bacterium]